MNSRDLVAVFWTWMDSVTAVFSGGIGALHTSRRVRLTEEGDDTFKVDSLTAGKNTNAAAEYIRIVQGDIVGPLSKPLATMLRGSRIELILQSGRFLFRPLDLPKRAGEFLGGIVRSQIDRLTPWSPADAVFGWTAPSEAAKDRIALTVVATAQAHISPYVQALASLGAKSITVSALPRAGIDVTAPIEVLRQNGAGAIEAGRIRRVLAVVLAISALSFGVTVAADQVISGNLDAEKSEVLRQVGERRAVIRRDGLGGTPSNKVALEHRKRETPSTVIVLEALSHILPDHTYATEVRVEGDKLQVVGITHDAPSLIRLIEDSPQFTRATFFAPTTRSPDDPDERFHIEARIKPAFTVQR